LYAANLARGSWLFRAFELVGELGNALWYDKYNVYWLSNERKEGQIDDIRSGEVYFEVTSSDIAYTFVVQGCVEDRFFNMTIHSTCTNWSNERRILLNPLAHCTNAKWKWLYRSRYPLFKCDSSSA
jgi:hypothetical protein